MFSYFRTNEFDLVCQLMLRNNPFSTENETRRLQFHDAGYDSFITGLCFVALQKISDQGEPGSIWNDERIRNCLYNSHSHDIAYISPEKDIPIIRKNVFHVKFSGKVHSLRLMFNKLRTAVVTPLDDQQVLVAVLEKEIKNFCKQFQSCSDYQVTRYSEYVHTKRIKEKRDIKRMIQFQEETISSASCDYGHRGICERKINRIAELLRKKGPTTKAKGPIYISLREPKKNRSNKSKHETVKRFKSEHSPSMENGRVEKSVTTIEFNSW